MMGIALTMARRGLGQTAPNPSVGAVLVDPATGEVIARGTTGPGGRPHAETTAIARARERARGATLYVTLEPCSHHGQTAPCADAIIASGITRVVCAIEDPDPRVAGRGLSRLRAAGLDVARGVRAAEADWLTRGHIVRVTQRRPFVQLKLALAADGLVPQGKNGQPTFVTSPDARALGHLLRAQADAILVGHGTVAADDPDLTCRLPGLAARSPRRVILARNGLNLRGTRLAQTAATVPVTVYKGSDVAPAVTSAMTAQGATIHQAQAIGGALWLPAVLEDLAASGITRLLVEGGPRIWRAFAQAGLVDDIVGFVAGRGVGDSAAVNYIKTHLGHRCLHVRERRTIGPDTVWRMSFDPSSSG